MTDYTMLRLQVDQALARAAFHEQVLQNIANGHWNAGRAEPMTAEQYAAVALQIYRPVQP